MTLRTKSGRRVGDQGQAHALGRPPSPGRRPRAGSRARCRSRRSSSGRSPCPSSHRCCSVACLIASIALSRGITPDSAKKHVCRIVFTRDPRPRPEATRDASITWSLSFLSMNCCCTSRGSSFQTSSDRIRAVDEHRGARRRRRQRIELVEEVELVDADEVRRLQQVRRADRPRAEAQVRDRVGARTSSSRRRSSPAHGGRSPQARIFVEFLFAPTVPSAPRPKNSARTTSGGSMSKLASTARLVCDTSSLMPTVKPCFGAGFFSSSKTALAIAGSKSLDDKPYRPPTMIGHRRDASGGERLGEGGDDVEIQRFAGPADFLRAIEHGNLRHGRRQRRAKALRVPGAVERHVQHADLLAVRVQPRGGLVEHFEGRADDDRDPIRLGMTAVAEQTMRPAGERATRSIARCTMSGTRA